MKPGAFVHAVEHGDGVHVNVTITSLALCLSALGGAHLGLYHSVTSLPRRQGVMETRRVWGLPKPLAGQGRVTRRAKLTSFICGL